MDLADLRVFEAVARLGAMSHAAAALNTVQSAVTARIKALEGELGAPLFQRHSRGVALTPAGQRLLPYARRMAALAAEARRAALDDGTPRGPLTVGSLETTAALRLAPLLTRFAAAHPRVDLSLRTGTTCELLEMVLEDKVEGAFVCGPVRHPDLLAETAFAEELVVLTAARVATLEALLADPDPRIVVLRSGCSYRQRLEELLTRRGVAAPRRLEFGTIEALLACVAAGLGATLLPRGLVGPAWREGAIAMHRLPPEEAQVETLFVRRAEASPSSALRAFLALMAGLELGEPVSPQAMAEIVKDRFSR